jgi:hypothetical protein
MTRATILERAYEMYLDRQITHGDERLSVVLDDLGYTTGAGYQIWPNQGAFRLELQVYIAENIEYADPAHVDREIAELFGQELGFRQHTLAVGDLYADYFLGREDFYLTLRFLAMAEDRPPEVTTAMRDAYIRLGWGMAERFSRALDYHGRRMCDPFTVEQLATATTALVEGFALQHRIGLATEPVDVEGHAHHQFSVAFLALVELYTEPL